MVMRPLRALPMPGSAPLADAWLERIGGALSDPALDRPRFCREILCELAYPDYAANWETAVADASVPNGTRLALAAPAILGPLNRAWLKFGLLLHHIGMSTAPALYRKLPFNPLTDYEYIGQVADVPMTVIAKTGLPPDNLVELIAYVKKNKEKLNLGNAGLGAASHLCGLLFQSALKVDMTTVPYKGTAPAMNDLMGGQIDLMCDQTTNTTSQIEAKTIKAFAVTTPKRLTTPSLKDLPTMDESGLKGFEVTIWHGLYAPKGTSADVLSKISSALKTALKDPEFVKKQQALGAVVVTDKRIEPAEHRKFVQAEIDKWGPIIKAAGVYAD